MGHRGHLRLLHRGDRVAAAGGRGQANREALPERVWAGVVEGLSFVWNTKVLRTLAIIDLTATGLYMPMESVLFPPKYFTDRNEPAQLAGC